MTEPLGTIRSGLGQPGLRVDPRKILHLYLERVHETERQGEGREESFYPHLVDLFEWYGEHRGLRDLRVTMIPRKTQSCLLDFQVRRGARITGYVEAKRPGTDLIREGEGEQVRRYRRTFPNLLLTNFREIWLYREGDLVARAEVGRLTDGPARLLEILDLFTGFDPPPGLSAAALAKQLASRTRILADRIEGLLERDPDKASDLAGFYEAFSEYLLAGITSREFADLYAQTLSYGLLAARWQTPGHFDRQVAAESIPPSSGILRDVFRFISLADPVPEVGWIVDEIVALLAAAPVRAMLDRYYLNLQRRRGRGRDPVLDFYQTFLRHYDPGLRRQRGVFYTPPELVSYVVRSVDRLLRTRLGKPRGLAEPGVTLLDPAAGTLTFMVEAIHCAVESAREEMGGGGVPALLRDHLLQDFHAFELMMAPYAIGHLKMSLILEELGRPPGKKKEERFHLYLTNALDTRELVQSSLPYMSNLSQEAHDAGKVKKDLRMTVILGNPPWSGHSANRDQGRDEEYHRMEGKERNTKWLQDDYVKFLRFAQRKVDEAGEGIVAFVTNHSYLDNPTFRGMRRSLMATFDEIYLLDLHGNGKKKERAPDGGADANVFEDVRQGAAVALFVKRPVEKTGLSKRLPKRIFRADLWGSRADKLHWLADHDVETTEWRALEPAGPAFLFAPRDAALEKEYNRGAPLTEIFPQRSVGIVTGRDAFVIDTDPAELRRRIRLLRETGSSPEALKDTPTWSLPRAVEALRKDPTWEARFHPILYRPFDRRTIFYAGYLVERPREQVMRHLLSEKNLGLIVPRQAKEGPGALITDVLGAHKAVSAYDINSLFPLYLETAQGRLDGHERIPNLAPDCLRLGEEPSPELVLQYVYAVLYSPPYRRRYDSLLRTDFPRIPLPRDRGSFLELAGLGAVLIDLHLLRSDRLDHPGVRFTEGQRFEGIAPEVWAYRVGGYQVLDQWLTARSHRFLRLQEIEEFRRIAAALRETLRLERRIEEVWPF